MHVNFSAAHQNYMLMPFIGTVDLPELSVYSKYSKKEDKGDNRKGTLWDMWMKT